MEGPHCHPEQRPKLPAPTTPIRAHAASAPRINEHRNTYIRLEPFKEEELDRVRKISVERQDQTVFRCSTLYCEREAGCLMERVPAA